MKIKKGNIVVRYSYGKDIEFVVKDIIDTKYGKIAILRGIFKRIEADSYLEDLEVVEKVNIRKIYNDFENRIDREVNNIKIELELERQKLFNMYNEYNSRIGIGSRKKRYITGKILHLDGDKKYSEKSYRYYRKLGLEAIVRNIPEYKQPSLVYKLLKIYNPDILVITGHDGMIKNKTRYKDIYNYRNSIHFVNTVKEARKYDMEIQKKLVIFAGACQSYFEALIAAGANFASSPARILIDFMDPLIVSR